MSEFAPFPEGGADWLISEGLIDGSRVVYAMRDREPSEQVKNHFSILVLVRWQFEKASELDFPSDAE